MSSSDGINEDRARNELEDDMETIFDDQDMDSFSRRGRSERKRPRRCDGESSGSKKAKKKAKGDKNE